MKFDCALLCVLVPLCLCVYFTVFSITLTISP